jgi:hypothetical protein
VLGHEAGFVAEKEREGGLLGDLNEGSGHAAAFANAIELGSDAGGHFVHLDIEHFVLHDPAAFLLPGAMDHALDGVLFGAVAGSVAGEVVDADALVLVVVFVDGDEGGDAEAMTDGVHGGAGFAFGGAGAGAFLSVGLIGCSFFVG